MLVLCFLAACATPDATRPVRARTNTAEAVARRSEQIAAELHEMELHEKNPDQRRRIHRIRTLWDESLRSRRKLDAIFRRQNVTFDAKYYALRQRQLNMIFESLQGLQPARQ